jgi:endonuclease/exonuclease/phosphatase family metal-dependent hydrolase
MGQTTFRVASYNIRKARGLDQKRMPERIVQVINGLGADVVALQEADLRLGARKAALPHRMIEAETDFRVVPLARNAVSIGWHGNAVLVRKTLTVTGVRHIELPGFEPRGAVRVDVADAGGMAFVAAHLGLIRRDRRAQLTAIERATADCARTIVAGDFNEWSSRIGFEPLKERFEVHAPGRSFHARRPIAALDRIALSDGLRMADAGVEQGALARRASDHLPIWMDVEWSPTSVAGS